MDLLNKTLTVSIVCVSMLPCCINFLNKKKTQENVTIVVYSLYMQKKYHTVPFSFIVRKLSGTSNYLRFITKSL